MKKKNYKKTFWRTIVTKLFWKGRKCVKWRQRKKLSDEQRIKINGTCTVMFVCSCCIATCTFMFTFNNSTISTFRFSWKSVNTDHKILYVNTQILFIRFLCGCFLVCLNLATFQTIYLYYFCTIRPVLLNWVYLV